MSTVINNTQNCLKKVITLQEFSKSKPNIDGIFHPETDKILTQAWKIKATPLQAELVEFIDRQIWN